MKFATLAAVVIAASPSLAATYPITGDSVNCRAGPGTSYSVKMSYAKGHQVSITCQTPGDTIDGDSIWDMTSDGCYVADYYVKTGSSGYVTGKCGGGGGGYCTGINAAGTDLITQWEGFVARPMPDPIGLPTVGYGHLCQQKNCAEVKYPFPLTTDTARKLLADDIPRYTSCLAGAINARVALNDNQWAALTSWTFNVGCGNVESSTLVKRLNNGESPNTVAAQELPKWNKGGGSVLPGLVSRRKAEVALFTTASSKQAHPSCA